MMSRVSNRFPSVDSRGGLIPMVLPLAMGWRRLLFDNWPVAPDVVAAHLPDALDVDVYDGAAWLSVVPFTNVDVRPAGLPAAAGFDLPELNLRTYVTADGEPGVYFFSLDAAGVFGVLGARVFHHLPYYYASIRLDVTDGQVSFESRRRHPGARPVAYRATYAPAGPELAVDPGSRAAFLTERYRYYTEDRAGRLRYADVRHEPWTLHPARASVAENSLFRADGFADPTGEPVRYYSPGLDVVASESRRWR